MQNYDIRYDDKYGQLAQIDVAAEGQGYEAWVNQTLTSVNDCVVRLAVIEGELIDWHSHEHEDEFFLALDGSLELDVEEREPFLLGVHQGVTIPRDVSHRPRAHGRTVLLMIGARDGDPDMERLTEPAPRCRCRCRRRSRRRGARISWRPGTALLS